MAVKELRVQTAGARWNRSDCSVCQRGRSVEDLVGSDFEKYDRFCSRGIVLTVA